MIDVRELYNCIKSNKWKVVCLIIVVVVAWLVWYYWLAIYVVYAVKKEAEDNGGREVVYRSMFFDKAKEKYLYLNCNKEKGVKYYILMNKEEGNSLIPY